MVIKIDKKGGIFTFEKTEELRGMSPGKTTVVCGLHLPVNIRTRFLLPSGFMENQIYYEGTHHNPH